MEVEFIEVNIIYNKIQILMNEILKKFKLKFYNIIFL